MFFIYFFPLESLSASFFACSPCGVWKITCKWGFSSITLGITAVWKFNPSSTNLSKSSMIGERASWSIADSWGKLSLFMLSYLMFVIWNWVLIRSVHNWIINQWFSVWVRVWYRCGFNVFLSGIFACCFWGISSTNGSSLEFNIKFPVSWDILQISTGILWAIW